MEVENDSTLKYESFSLVINSRSLWSLQLLQSAELGPESASALFADWLDLKAGLHVVV